MNKEQLQTEIDALTWFHSIPLPWHDPKDPENIWGIITTPGSVDYCTPEIADNRFGIPTELMEKRILDVGCWDGYFSFMADQRCAEAVIAIDPLSGCSSLVQSHAPFELAHKALDSRVVFLKNDLQDFYHSWWKNAVKFDMIFYFGVLYHTESPFLELRILADMLKPGGIALIETAMSTRWFTRGAMWELKPGFDGDETNTWYPTEKGIVEALFAAGFTGVERIYISRDRSRATFKATK